MLTEDFAAVRPSSRPRDTFTVLLVDDNDAYAEYVREVFRQIPGSPIAFLHVRRLSDVLPMASTAEVTVMLLDVDLPDGNGLKWLSEHRDELEAAVIVLTAFEEYGSTEELAAAAQDFLVKNEVEPDHLVRAVRYAADRERVRQQLLRGREYFQSLIEQARDLITVIDETGTVLYQSPASRQLLGCAPEDAVGGRLLDMVAEEDAPRLRTMLESVFCGNDKAPGGEFRLRHADGTTRTLDVIASRIASSAERKRAVLNSRDVTERRRAEEELRARDERLRQSQKIEAVGRLAGGIAHDISNVLTVITGACERLRDGIQSGVPSETDVEMILNNCRRAASLTRQLLAFSRQQRLAPQPLDLGQLVGRAGRLLKRLIGEHIALTIETAPGLPAVLADPVQIEQVLMNLAINARDAMPAGGSLHLSLRNVIVDEAFHQTHLPMPSGPYVLLQVSDTGCGMSPEVKAHAFEPFFTTKGPLQGTGLGLSTVYGIVKQSGGYIWIDTAPDRGTTFSIYMPPTDARPVALEAPRQGPPQSVTPKVILLTEDDDDVRQLVGEMLRGQKHTVIEAANPEDALTKAARFDGHIDLLLTDVIMPGGTGRDLARRICGARPDMKVLYISGYPEHDAVPGPVLEPGLPFLSKPFTRDVLLQKLHDLLQ